MSIVGKELLFKGAKDIKVILKNGEEIDVYEIIEINEKTIQYKQYAYVNVSEYLYSTSISEIDRIIKEDTDDEQLVFY